MCIINIFLIVCRFKCCEREDESGCKEQYSCCGALPISQGCNRKYPCCDNDENHEGCKKICGSCSQDWGTPTMTCKKLEDPTKDHLDLVINEDHAQNSYNLI